MPYYIVHSVVKEPGIGTSATNFISDPIEAPSPEAAFNRVRREATASVHGGSEDVTIYRLDTDSNGEPYQLPLDVGSVPQDL